MSNSSTVHPTEANDGPKGTPPPRSSYIPPTIISLGNVKSPHRFGKGWVPYEEAFGVVIEIERGYGTKCHRWCGSYARGRPVYKTRDASYSPIKLLFEKRCRTGYIESLCGFADCVNPSHHRITPWRERMAQIRPKARDKKTGRYLKG